MLLQQSLLQDFNSGHQSPGPGEVTLKEEMYSSAWTVDEQRKRHPGWWTEMDGEQWPFCSRVVRWTEKALDKLSLWKGEYHIVMTGSTAPWWQIDFRQYSWIVKRPHCCQWELCQFLHPLRLSRLASPCSVSSLSHLPFSFPHPLLY